MTGFNPWRFNRELQGYNVLANTAGRTARTFVDWDNNFRIGENNTQIRENNSRLARYRSEDRLDYYNGQQGNGGYTTDRNGRPIAGNGQDDRGLGYSRGGNDGQLRDFNPNDPRNRPAADFLHAMEKAASEPAGPARTAALADAVSILNNPRAGLKAADGSIHFPTITVPNRVDTVNFGVNPDDGKDYRDYRSAEAAMAQIAGVLSEQRIGTISSQEIAAAAAARPAGTTNGVGRDAGGEDRDPNAGAPTLPPGQERPAAPGPGAGSGSGSPRVDLTGEPDAGEPDAGEEPDAPGAGAGTGAAPGASTTAKPAAAAGAKHGNAKLYSGITKEQAPAIDQDRVTEIQNLLGKENLPKYGADGKWGKETQAAFEKAAKAAGIPDPSKIDFTDPKNPLTKQFDTYVRTHQGTAKPATGLPSNQPAVTKVILDDLSDRPEPVTYKGSDGKSHVAYGKDGKPLMTSTEKPYVGDVFYEDSQIGNGSSPNPKYAYSYGSQGHSVIVRDANGNPVPPQTQIGANHKYNSFKVTTETPEIASAKAAGGEQVADIVVTASRAQVDAAKDPAKMAAAVAALKAFAGTDGVISAADLQSLNPEKVAAGDARTQAGNKLGALANALNLNDDTKLDDKETATAVAASGIRVEGGAAAFNPLFKNMTFASASAAQADVPAAVPPAVAQTVSPAKRTSEPRLDLNDVETPRVPQGNPALKRDKGFNGPQ